MTNDDYRVNSFFVFMLVKERRARRTRQVDAKGRSAAFRDIAEGPGLGVADRGKIERVDVSLS